MSPLFLSILNVIRILLGYFLPFFAVWMLIRRLEKGVAEHIGSWWFYGATISLLAKVTLESLGLTTTILPLASLGWIGDNLTIACMYLVYIFIIKVKCYLLDTKMYSEIKNHLGVVLPFSVILIGLAYPCDKAPILFYITWATAMPTYLFIMFSYLELAWFFKRFKCNLWPLLVVGAIVGMGVYLSLTSSCLSSSKQVL
jgi:hypothetical protein